VGFEKRDTGQGDRSGNGTPRQRKSAKNRKKTGVGKDRKGPKTDKNLKKRGISMGELG